MDIKLALGELYIFNRVWINQKLIYLNQNLFKIRDQVEELFLYKIIMKAKLNINLINYYLNKI